MSYDQKIEWKYIFDECVEKKKKKMLHVGAQTWAFRLRLILIIICDCKSLGNAENALWFDLMNGHFAIIVDSGDSSLFMEFTFGTFGRTGEWRSWYSEIVRLFEWFARRILWFETVVNVWLILIKKKDDNNMSFQS